MELLRCQTMLTTELKFLQQNDKKWIQTIRQNTRVGNAILSTNIKRRG
jgi:hypothetical protein